MLLPVILLLILLLLLLLSCELSFVPPITLSSSFGSGCAGAATSALCIGVATVVILAAFVAVAVAAFGVNDGSAVTLGPLRCVPTLTLRTGFTSPGALSLSPSALRGEMTDSVALCVCICGAGGPARGLNEPSDAIRVRILDGGGIGFSAVAGGETVAAAAAAGALATIAGCAASAVPFVLGAAAAVCAVANAPQLRHFFGKYACATKSLQPPPPLLVGPDAGTDVDVDGDGVGTAAVAAAGAGAGVTGFAAAATVEVAIVAALLTCADAAAAGTGAAVEVGAAAGFAAGAGVTDAGVGLLIGACVCVGVAVTVCGLIPAAITDGAVGAR